MKRIFLVAMTILSGCASMSPSTMLHLSRFDPLTADPANFTVDIAVPSEAGIVANSAKFSVTAQQTPDAKRIEEVFVLQSSKTLDAALRFKLNPQDGPRLQTIQRKAAAWEKADARAASGSFSVNFDPCIFGAGPAADALLAVAIQTHPDGPFRSLFSGVPWHKFMTEISEGAELPQCPPTDTVPR